MRKTYHIPGNCFGNLNVPSEAPVFLTRQLEPHFFSIIESTTHHQYLCDVLYQNLSRFGDFYFSSSGYRKRFSKMLYRVRLCSRVRFVNRNLNKVRFEYCFWYTALQIQTVMLHVSNLACAYREIRLEIEKPLFPSAAWCAECQMGRWGLMECPLFRFIILLYLSIFVL